MPAFFGGDINVVSKILHKKHFFYYFFVFANLCTSKMVLSLQGK